MLRDHPDANFQCSWKLAPPRRILLPALAVLVVLLNSGIAAAQVPGEAALLDSAALAAFGDTFFTREMVKRRIPGAVIVVVRAGQVVLSRGYGYADLASRRPVDPDRTLFRVGSISKVITATAALQLVEQGRLELHRNVNDYLVRLQIEETFREPITLHHLLTHTAGFEDRLTGIAAKEAAALGPLAETLGSNMPARVRPPGVAISYSNHGTALIGLLIEEITGMPFHEYVRQYVQAPVGMLRSGFRLTPDLASDLATGYEIVGGEYRAIPLDFIRLDPAGNFAATGSDMARFLLAHLGGGTYEHRRVLRPETTDLMHSPQFVHHPRVPAWCYGFYQSARVDQRVLMHTGGSRDFRSVLFFLPTEAVGVFLSYSRADEGPIELQQAFVDRFLERYLPQARIPLESSDEASVATVLEGRYRYIRHAHTTAEKIVLLTSGEVRVRRDRNDRLVALGLSAAPVQLLPAGGLLFRRTDGEGYVAFEEVGDGTAARLVWGTHFPIVMERIRWWEGARVQGGAVAVLGLFFVLALLRWPVARGVRAVRRTHGGVPAQLETEGQLARRAWAVAGLAATLNVGFLVTFPLAFLGRAVGGWPEFMYGMPGLASALLVLPWITTGLACTALGFAIALWRRQSASLPERVHYAATTLALLLFIPFALYWNLLGRIS